LVKFLIDLLAAAQFKFGVLYGLLVEARILNNCFISLSLYDDHMQGKSERIQKVCLE